MFDRHQRQAHFFERTPRGAFRAPVTVHGLGDSVVRERMDEDTYRAACDELMMLEIAGERCDVEAVRAGDLAPVFFGSAVNNFGVQLLLDAWTNKRRTTIMKANIPNEIRNRHGERLDFTYHPGAPEVSTLVVLGHGVTGNKDRPLLVELADALARAGVHALRFSFAGNGASEGRFENATVTKEVDDLGAVLDALPGWNIGYAGHSMGAAVGIVRAGQDARIRFLISLGGMAHTAAFAQREFADVKPGAGCMWDKPECPLSQAYLDDMARVGSVVEAARRVRVPWLFVHGQADDVVPPQDSRDLLAVASEPKRLVEVPDADHVFSDHHAAAMAGVVVAWMKELRL